MSQSPFPGMDPYLESPELWPDVHNSFVPIFREQLMPLLAPKYVAELDSQIVIERVLEPPRIVLPDVGVTHSPPQPGEPDSGVAVAPAPLQLTVPVSVPTRLVTLYIRRRETAQLVTVLELLSPVNKRPGAGRRDYLAKRNTYFDSDLHVVEIDLLRAGPRMPFGGDLPECAYVAMVSRAEARPACEVWPIGLRDPLPVLPIPLLAPDPPVPLDTGQALRTAFERARYDLRIDYASPPTPPLSPAEAEWATALPGES